MRGIFEDLAKGFVNAVAPDDPDVKILNAQSDITRLKEEEIKIFAEIGKRAIELEGSDKFGELSEKLKAKQSEIIEAENSLNSAKQEKEAKNAQENVDTKSFCTNCGIQNEEGVKFCRECGTKLENAEEVKPCFCTACGTENKSGTKFCINCGVKI